MIEKSSSGIQVNRRPPRILWDVLEEHLDEAAFLWKQRERALLAPDYVLGDVAEGDEARLLAHVEGLVVGGAPVAERLLLPALAGEQPERVGPAALALLASKEKDWTDSVLRHLLEGAEESRPGLLHALALSGREGLDGALLRILPETAGQPLQAALLEVLRFRQVDPGPTLERSRPDEDPVLFAAVLRAARFTARPVAMALVRQGLEDSRPQVRSAALETGLILGLRAAWLAGRRLVREVSPDGRLARLALALGGESEDVQLLIQAAREPRLRSEALWAMGFSGRLAAAEAALEALREEGGLERLAVEAFALVTGLPLVEGFLVEEQAREGDGEEVQAGETEPEEVAHLPGPALLPGKVALHAVEAWWREARGRFEGRGRYVQGKPWTLDSLLALLLQAPMRQRPIWAWELAIRSGGACQVETRDWTARQRHRIQGVQNLRIPPVSRGFGALMTS